MSQSSGEARINEPYQSEPERTIYRHLVRLTFDADVARPKQISAIADLRRRHGSLAKQLEASNAQLKRLGFGMAEVGPMQAVEVRKHALFLTVMQMHGRRLEDLERQFAQERDNSADISVRQIVRHLQHFISNKAQDVRSWSLSVEASNSKDKAANEEVKAHVLSMLYQAAAAIPEIKPSQAWFAHTRSSYSRALIETDWGSEIFRLSGFVRDSEPELTAWLGVQRAWQSGAEGIYRVVEATRLGLDEQLASELVNRRSQSHDDNSEIHEWVREIDPDFELEPPRPTLTLLRGLADTGTVGPLPAQAVWDVREARQWLQVQFEERPLEITAAVHGELSIGKGLA